MSLPALSQRAVVFEELASFLAGGHSMPEAVAAIRASLRRPSTRNFLAHVEKKLMSGTSIGEAFRGSGLAAADIALISAGERSGTLEDTFQKLAEAAKLSAESRNAIIARLIYPAVIFHLAVLLPALPALVSGASPSEVALQLIATLGIAYCVVTLLTILGTLLWQAAATSRFCETILLLVPFAGGIHKSGSQARFLQVLGLQMDAGVNLFDAFIAAGTSSRSARLTKVAGKSGKLLSSGSTAEQIIADSAFFPEALLSQNELAAKTGNTARNLQQWASTLRIKTEKKRKTAVFWLGQIIYLTALIYAGWQIIAMYAGVLEQYAKILDGI